MPNRLLIAALCCLATTAHAEEEPLWEFGVGAFGLYAPDYPASGESSFNGLPFPYVIYRGDFFRLDDEDGARIVPLETARFRFDISADAAFGVNSDDNDAREGLEDLDPLVQIGPQVVVEGPRFAGGQLEFALAARAVYSVDFDDIEYQGAVLEPRIRYERELGTEREIGLFASVQPIWATEELQDYFYEVDAPFATPSRPAFDAGGGYLGTEVSLGLSAEITDRLQLFAGTGLGFYEGAENEDSPLFEEDVTAAAFLGFAYTLRRSERMVRRD